MAASSAPGNAQPQAVSPHRAGTALNTRYGGGLPSWAVGVGSEGKDGVEIKTEDTVLLSFGGGQQALAQRDPGHVLHAGQAVPGCSNTGWPFPKRARVTPRNLLGARTARWRGLSTVNVAPSFSICLCVLTTFSFFLHILWQGLSDTFRFSTTINVS